MKSIFTRVQFSFITNKFLVSEMAQRSIKDFFGNKNSKNLSSNVEKEIENPPKKKLRSKSPVKNEENINNSETSIQNKDKTNNLSPKPKQESNNNPPQINNNDFKNKENTSNLYNFKVENVTQKNIVKQEDYDPSLADYNPLTHTCWKQGDKVPFLALAKTFNEIEKISARLKMIQILSNFFWSLIKLSPDDLLPSVYLALNKLAPDYEGIELGIGETLIMKAIASSTGRRLDQIKAEVEKKGDLGLVAESSRSNQRVMFQPPSLILSFVYSKLKEVALLTGNSSQNKKTSIIHSMLIASKDCETKFLVRLLTGKLRIGLAEQSVILALAQAITLNEFKKKRESDGFKELYDKVSEIIKSAYCQCPNFDRIVQVYFESGYDSILEKCSLTPGIPLKPMLAHPTKGVHEVFKRIENSSFTCEFKYDGERAQIHFEKTKLFPSSLNNEKYPKVSIYSRNQENNTSKYPDIISRISDSVNDSVTSFILDCEAVAWDLKTKQILPFQILSTRKRKDAKENEITVQVCLYAFDLLYLNEKSLIQLPFRERRNLLKENFKEIEGQFFYAQSKDLESVEEVEEFLEESIKGKCEGLMIKTLDDDATYEIAKRSHKWLKLKKDYLDGVGDTLDLVVIGAYFGKGKRTGSYGGYLLACYDDENEEFQSICKLGTGFKDEDLEQHYKFFQEHKASGIKKYYKCDESIKPDVWFEPVQVWEIKCADISLSPVYKAAIGHVDENKGISLRFPRFIRVREDKKPEMATNSSQVAEIYKNQEIFKNNDLQNEDF